MTTVTDATARIEELFCQGHTIEHIIGVGADEGWTPDDVREVLREREWDLDGSGRIPRHQRITAPRGLRHPPPPPPRPTPPPPAAPVRAGTSYIAAVQARELGVDHTYQRPLDEARVKRMVADWDPRMLGTLDVSDRGEHEHPRYAVIAGQHRASAAAKVSPYGPDVWLPCNVHEGLTVAEEAALMHRIERETKRLVGHDQWRARRVAGDEAVLAVERVVAAHGLRIGSQPLDGVMRSYGTAEKLLELGGEKLLDQALAVLRAAYKTSAAGYQAPLLMAVGQLLHRGAGVDVPRLTRALAANRPEQLRAAATALREERKAPLHTLMATAVAAAYNRTQGPGPRLTWSR